MREGVAVALVVALGLILVVASCDDRGAGASGTRGDAGVSPDSSSDPACLETLEYPDVPRTTYTRKTWDEARRVLTATSSSTSDFADPSTLQWHYASEGRLLSYGGGEVPRQTPFQHDRHYDDRDNLSRFVFTYPDHVDVTVYSTAPPYIQVDYANEYEADGRLSATTVTTTGAFATPKQRRVFSEDDAHRCTRIETTSDDGNATEIRTYYDDGRLMNIARTDTAGRSTTETFTYDGEGRPTHRTYTITGGSFPGTVTETYVYQPDGSVKREVFDAVNDVLGEQHYIETRASACLDIDKKIGKRTDDRCRVE